MCPVFNYAYTKHSLSTVVGLAVHTMASSFITAQLSNDCRRIFSVTCP